MIIRFNVENKINVKIHVWVYFYISKKVESLVKYEIDPFVLKFIAPEKFLIGSNTFYYHVHSIIIFEEGNDSIYMDRLKLSHFDKTSYDDCVTISINKLNDYEYKISCR